MSKLMPRAAVIDRMSPLDALFLDAEDHVSHMHIGSCGIFQGPVPDEATIDALVASKLPALQRYRQRVRFVPGGLGRPVWADDPEFSLAYHVRRTALASPGDQPALERLMGRLMSAPLDRERPLWEAWIVEGLSHGRWALISKVHHCMVDGISGTDLMAVLLDSERSTVPTPVEPWEPAPAPTDVELVVDSLSRIALSPARQLRLLRASLEAPGRAVRQMTDVVDGLASYGRRLAVPSPLASIEGHIGPHRRWACARSSLDDVRAIRNAHGGSVNDVVLAAIAGAFRQLLVERGDQVDGVTMRSLVPVSVRTSGDHSANNQVTAIIAELPVGIADPLERLRAVREQMDRLKVSHQAEAGAAVLSAADLAPPQLVSFSLRAGTSLLRRLPQRSVNTVTTNVPGPRHPLYAAGREMLEYFPFVPLSQGVRVGVAILSYNGRVGFGVTGDYDTVPDTARMAALIEDAMVELREPASTT